MAFYLSRQRQYPEGFLYIEIAINGKAHAGPDVLTPKFSAELRNFVNPKDAIRLAEEVYNQWSIYSDEIIKLRIVGKDMAPIILDCNKRGFEAANLWADKVYSGMKKCGNCNKPMGNRDVFETEDISNLVFCSEVCISRKYRDMFGVEAPKIVSNKAKNAIKGNLLSKP